MNGDIEVLRAWIRVVLIIAAICTTAVPIIYSFSPWRSRPFGRLFMMQAISFAVAMDLSALFSVWHPVNILILFWVDALILTLIAASTSAMAGMMWRMSHPSKKGKQNAS